MGNLTSIQVIVLGIFDEWDGVNLSRNAIGFGPINRISMVVGEGDSPYESAARAIESAKEQATSDNVIVITNIENLSKSEHLDPKEWRHYSIAILSSSRKAIP